MKTVTNDELLAQILKEAEATEADIEQTARRFANNEFLRQRLAAKISCASTQEGHHIDTLARDAPTERSSQNLPTVLEIVDAREEA